MNNIDDIINQLTSLIIYISNQKLTCTNKINLTSAKYIHNMLTEISKTLAKLHADAVALDYIRQAQEIVDESSVQREIVRRLNNVLGILCL